MAEHDDEKDNLEGLLDKVDEVASKADSKVSVDDVYRAVGERSFGPLLFLAGLLTSSPLSGIPGVPTALGIIVVLVASQMLVGRETFWLPKRLLKLKVNAKRLRKSVKFAHKPARFVDRFVRPRLCFLTEGLARRIVALVCVLVGAATPPLELVPFSTILPATAIATFGLGLTVRDGVVILIALAASAGTAGLIIWRLVLA